MSKMDKNGSLKCISLAKKVYTGKPYFLSILSPGCILYHYNVCKYIILFYDTVEYTVSNQEGLICNQEV
jgi:hypothetical protein